MFEFSTCMLRPRFNCGKIIFSKINFKMKTQNKKLLIANGQGNGATPHSAPARNACIARTPPCLLLHCSPSHEPAFRPARANSALEQAGDSNIDERTAWARAARWPIWRYSVRPSWSPQMIWFHIIFNSWFLIATASKRKSWQWHPKNLLLFYMCRYENGEGPSNAYNAIRHRKTSPRFPTAI